MEDLINGKVRFSQLRKLNIEDLLGKKAIHLDNEVIAKMLRDKVILVSGCRRFNWIRALSANP